MRVLLRDTQTGHYFAQTGAWVNDVAQAQHFGTIEAAGKAALSCTDFDLSVVLKYEDTCELALNPAYCLPRANARPQGRI